MFKIVLACVSDSDSDNQNYSDSDDPTYIYSSDFSDSVSYLNNNNISYDMRFRTVIDVFYKIFSAYK